MKYWNHNELHVLMEADPKLKARSDQTHALPSGSLDEREAQMCQMIKIYVKAVGCQRPDNAISFTKEVFTHIKSQCLSWEEWKKVPAQSHKRKKLQELGELFKARKRCHPPNGNDYVCYCKLPKKHF